MAAETAVPDDGAAAVRIQKTYRGYRARRKLADAAIMSKPLGWWNLVDAVVLQQNTLQYYAHSKSWKANDNWKRLKRKASKLGKGLEKNNKALKLVLQHWLEAIDARHRYGHNLRHYYLYWLELKTHEPFFWWLDVGSGRQVEMPKCSRATLHEQQITYLSPDQRKHYEVAIYHGKLYYQSSGELVHTLDKDRWIFVMSPSYKLYIGKKIKGKFQHSSFLAGGATTAAGRLVVTHGMLKLMEAHSGHYRPSPENFEALVGILVNRGADLHLAKVQLVSDDVVEKKKAKELAGKVRDVIQGTCEESNVGVKVENQRLVSVDSGVEGATEYLVTNLTFPEYEAAVATRKHAEEAEKEEQSRTTFQPEQQQQQQPIVSNGAPKTEPAEEALTAVDKEQPPVLKEEDSSAQGPAGVEEATVRLKHLLVVKKKPAKLELPVAAAAGALLEPGPKSATLPSSPGFSRSAHLATLGQYHRHAVFEKSGLRMAASESIAAIPQTC